MNDNQHLETEKTEMSIHIDKAIADAQNAFWQVIAERFPNITTGDFPPLPALSFDVACTQAVLTWVKCNME